MPPPPPLPPPNFLGGGGGHRAAPDNRHAMLAQIRQGTTLKKAVTVDKSRPLLASTGAAGRSRVANGGNSICMPELLFPAAPSCTLLGHHNEGLISPCCSHMLVSCCQPTDPRCFRTIHRTAPLARKATSAAKGPAPPPPLHQRPVSLQAPEEARLSVKPSRPPPPPPPPKRPLCRHQSLSSAEELGRLSRSLRSVDLGSGRMNEAPPPPPHHGKASRPPPPPPPTRQVRSATTSRSTTPEPPQPVSAFEQKFFRRFHTLHELPKPDTFTNLQKVYPSKTPNNMERKKRRHRPPPPPPLILKI